MGQGLTVLPLVPASKPRATFVVAAVLVSAGHEYKGPLTHGWAQECRLLHEFHAFASDSYSLHIEQVWSLDSPVEIDFRVAARACSGIAVLSQRHPLYVPVMSLADLQIQCQLHPNDGTMEQPACTLQALLREHGVPEGQLLNAVCH